MLLLAMLSVIALHAAANDTGGIGSAARGKALFEGREPLTGRIRGHDNVMPAEVLACGNCHALASGAASGVPVLDADALLTPKPRRNGPASSYNLETFCRLLRTGIDPVHILVSRTMPQFVLSTAQCDSLWLAVTDRSGR